MQKRFYRGQNDDEIFFLLDYLYFEALINVGFHFFMEFFWDRHVYSSMFVDVFSVKVAFLYLAIIDFDS